MKNTLRRPDLTRNRHRLPIERIFVLFLIALVLLGGSAASAQESARERVTALRGHLAQVEGTYADSLAETRAHQTATIKVDRLRADLRAKLETLINRSTSSEAALAVYHADAESTLDAIRAYEQGLGVGPGEETTFMNILSEMKLRTMRDQIHTRVDVLKREVSIIPPKDLDLSVEFRIRELEGWEQGLDLEMARRTSIGEVQLKTIRADVTAENARSKYPAISKADGPGSEPNFQMRLARQVNVRLNTAPRDASLAVLRNELPKIKRPDLSSPVARGPPQAAEDALTRLRSAQFEELTAVTRRDAIGIARARAKLKISSEWLRVARQNRQVNSTDDLIHLREGWRKWLSKVRTEQQPGTSSASLDFELIEAQSRIKELDTRIERRLIIPPPEGGDFNTASSGTDPPSSPSTPEIRALNRDWDRRLAYEEVSELAKASTEPRRIPNLDLNKAAGEAFHARINAEAQSLINTYDEIPRLQRQVLISGRGQTALEATKKIYDARNLIESSAQDLRAFLADPAFANNPEVTKVLASLSDIPSPKVHPGGNNLERGLIAFEKARDAAEMAAQPRGMVIQGVSNSTVVADPAFRINLPPAPVEDTPNPLIKRPTDYDNLYRRRQTLPEMLKDPKRAPGGVVIDAKLPADLASRFKSLAVDVETGAIRLQLGDSWRTLKARPDPLLARLAWAFVLDDQIAVIDLRPLEYNEALWLYQEYGKSELSNKEREKVVQQLARMTSVNVNKALRDTSLIPHLIAADQLMFDLLPQKPITIVGGDTRYGLPLRDLRLAFRADAGELINRPNWQDVLFNKSLLAVSEIKYQDGPELVLSPKFSFFLFGVTADGSSAINLNTSEQWFAAHEEKLKALDQLTQLNEFATLVALFRTANERHLPHNLDELIAVPTDAINTPRFIVRRERMGVNDWQQFQSSLSGRQ